MYKPCDKPSDYVAKLCPNFCTLYKTEQCPSPDHGKWEVDEHKELQKGEEVNCRTFKCALFVGNTTYKFLQANKALGNGDRNRELLRTIYGVEIGRKGKRI